MLQMKPGTLVVLEGIDAAGKTTALLRLRKREWRGAKPMFTHQPSGEDEVGREIYALTENYKSELSPWARQFLHLASHANHYDHTIFPHMERGGSVFLDRCWMSTMAYGWYAGGLHEVIEHDDMEMIVRLPARWRMPDIAFIFTDAWEDDPHNSPELHAAYFKLMETYDGTGDNKCPMIRIPAGLTKKGVADYIVGCLIEHGLATAYDVPQSPNA